MNDRSDPKLTPFAQKLRKNMTKEETRLWYGFLNKLPMRINRQKVIGRYIVDFYCASKSTVIEVDGGQHCSQRGRYSDAARDAYLEGLGLTVLRYSDHELRTDFDGVCADIYYRLSGVITEPQSAAFAPRPASFSDPDRE